MTKAIDTKAIVSNIKAGKFHLLNGKKQVMVTDHDDKKAKVTIDFHAIGKEGKISKKEGSTDITDPMQLIPMKGKLTQLATISESAVNRAMKAFSKSANGAPGKSAVSKSDVKKIFYAYVTTLKEIAASDDADEKRDLRKERNKALKVITKAGYEVRDDDTALVLTYDGDDIASRKAPSLKKAGKKADKNKASKKAARVYILLSKEKKVVAAKALKETKRGQKCSFKLDGEKEERIIKSDFIFEERDEAKAALKEMKKGKEKGKKAKIEKAAKVYVLLKKQKKVVAGKLLKELGSGKMKVAYKDPEAEEKTTKNFKPDVVFEERDEAKDALKELKKGKVKEQKGKEKGKGKKAVKTVVLCGACKHRMKKTDECPWYDHVYADSDICENFKAKK
jgi:hypothetical protein